MIRTSLIAIVLLVSIGSAFAQNKAPVVSAGKDTVTRLGLEFRLYGDVTDDGLPVDSPVTTMWKQLSGPTLVPETHFFPEGAGSAVFFPAVGTYRLQLKGSDGVLAAYDTIQIIVNDSIPFKVLFPKGGEKLLIGKTYNIRWQIDPPGTDVLVKLSIDGGATFPDELQIVANRITATNFSWKIPSTLQPTSDAVIMVQWYFSPAKAAYTGTFGLTNNPNEETSINMPLRFSTADGEIINAKAFSVSGRHISSVRQQKSGAPTGLVIQRSSEKSTAKKVMSR